MFKSITSKWNTIEVDIQKSQLIDEWSIPDSLSGKSCRIQVIQNNTSGNDYSTASLDFNNRDLTGVDLISNIKKFTLYPAHPNPFKPGK